MHTVILVTRSNEFQIGRATNVQLKKKKWYRGNYLVIEHVWLANARIESGGEFQTPKVFPFFGPPKRVLTIEEKIATSKKCKHCTIYSLTSGERVIVYNKST